MANDIGWGKAVNNDIGWGAYPDNLIGAGSVYAVSEFGETLGIKDDSAQVEFIISVKTDNVGTSNNDQYSLPITVGTYDVDWGDTNVDLAVSGLQTHTYSIAGTYEIKVTGGTRFLAATGGDKLKLIDIVNWGANEWTEFQSAFLGCTGLGTLTATDAPDLSSVIRTNTMFSGCTGMNGDFNAWDTSNVQTAVQMFMNCESFNSDLAWDLTASTDWNSILRDCDSFNGDVSTWDTSNLLNMGVFFYKCLAFDQDISGWSVSQATSLALFMTNVTLSTANYDALLIAWDAQGAMSYSGTVPFGNSTYTSGGAAEAARTSLISKWGGITDGGAA